MKKTLLAAAAASLALSGLALSASPALAHRPHHDGHRSSYAEKRHIYDSRGRYVEPRRMTRSDRIWRGRDGHYYCKRDNGTTGLVIGAAVGGLAGHEIAGNGDKTLGTIIGAIGGGLLGREVDRGDLKCR